MTRDEIVRAAESTEKAAWSYLIDVLCAREPADYNSLRTALRWIGRGMLWQWRRLMLRVLAALLR